MNKYSRIVEFDSKINANLYIGAGWELIEARAEPYALGRTIIIYRVGKPEGAGKPITPPTDDVLPE